MVVYFSAPINVINLLQAQLWPSVAYISICSTGIY